MTGRESRSSSAIEEIAAYVSEFRGSDSPDRVRDRAALIVADTVGCMVAGASQHHSVTYHDALRAVAGAEQASVVGTSWRTDVATAATANCVSADALEYSDSLLSHPALTAVPVALAFGEWLDRPGSEVLDAVIVGYEAGVRFGRALVDTRHIRPTQWAWQGFIAAASAARLLRLSADQTVDAFGHVAATAPVAVDMYRNGTPLPWGKTSYAEQTRAGVAAALLAQHGFRSTAGLVDGRHGYPETGGYGKFDWTELTAGLDTDWLILQNRFKRYPSCRMTHAAYEAALAIGPRLAGRPVSSIDSVEVRTVDEVALWLHQTEPHTLVDATFSVPFVVAAALTDTPPVLWYTDAGLGDPTLRALMRRVRCIPGAIAPHSGFPYPAEVAVTIDDGSIVTQTCCEPMILEESSEVREKFLTQVSPIVGADRAELGWRLCLTLDSADSVHALAAALSSGANR